MATIRPGGSPDAGVMADPLTVRSNAAFPATWPSASGSHLSAERCAYTSLSAFYFNSLRASPC